ncbi:MAG TPA: DHH family phosphoesterase, partial [Patescibacteria group bacterium]|nr:DHH family phosphoesterase [Patescibacteria group bacterium]
MNIITTTYKDPDLDGYGCAMAYAELLRATGKKAQAHIWGTPHIEVQWLIETFSLSVAKGPSDDTGAEVVLLDASETKNLPKPLKVEQVVEIIDHRKVHEADQFTNATNQIELIGAAATIVAERFIQQEVEPSKEAALYLLGAIISNTQNFTGVVTDRDRDAANWLREASNAPKDLAVQMFAAKSDLSGDRLRETLFCDLKTLTIENKAFAIGQLEITGVQKLLEERGEEIAATLLEISEKENADYAFINMKDLGTNTSLIMCNDEATFNLLKNTPDASSNGLLITSPTLTVRK